MECIRLRVQDVDFGQGLIFVRGGKGGKDRTTILPKNLQDELFKQIQAVKKLHLEDLQAGFGEVYISEALGRKYPNAMRETGWQWVFPAKERSIDPRSGKEMRHHVIWNRDCKKPSNERPPWQELTKKSAAIHFATASPPICSKTASIFVYSRNFSVMPMLKPPKSTSMSWRGISANCKVRWIGYNSRHFLVFFYCYDIRCLS